MNLTVIAYPSNSANSISLTYDADNRLTNMMDAVGTTRYSYAAFGALASEDGPWDRDTVTYAYTTNRLRSKLSLVQPNASDWVQTYTYDGANRLANTTSPAGAFGYSYRVGQISDPVGYIPYGTQHPAVGRLVERLALPSGAYITNAYDVL